MFTLIRLKQALSKVPKNVRDLQVRGLLTKKSSWDRLTDKFQIRSPSFEKIQNSKLTPEGYTVIYVSPFYYQLNFGHVLLSVSWPLVIWYWYKLIKSPEWETHKMKTLHSSKAAIAVAGLSVPIALHWLLLRNVRVIFKKKDQYKTLIYGLFGPLRKIYIDHGKYAYEKSDLGQLFHFLKSRRIIVFQECFYDELDYFSLIFIQHRNESYL